MMWLSNEAPFPGDAGREVHLVAAPELVLSRRVHGCGTSLLAGAVPQVPALQGHKSQRMTTRSAGPQPHATTYLPRSSVLVLVSPLSKVWHFGRGSITANQTHQLCISLETCVKLLRIQLRINRRLKTSAGNWFWAFREPVPKLLFNFSGGQVDVCYTFFLFKIL